MKKSKKIKLITSLSTLATTASAASVLSTGFAKQSSSSTKNTLNSDSNAVTIDVTTLDWVKKATYNSNNIDTIKETVINDNAVIFGKYRGLKAALNIVVTYTTGATPIKVSITNTGSNSRYTGATTSPITWNAAYSKTPTPTPTPTVTSVTYSELATLKTNSQLVVGKQYQITNYTATVNNSIYNNKAQSANYQFDLIVTAISQTELSETAAAVKHAGDTHFWDTNFGGWTIKYCFDNNTDKYDWATTNGKGVIYYMQDEFGNEAPYDFKNIQFKYSSDNLWHYTFSNTNVTKQAEIVDTSLDGDNNMIKNNTIEAYSTPFGQALNIIFFFGTECCNNQIKGNCHDLQFNNNCSGNTFAVGSNNIVCGNNVSGNAFNDGSQYIKLIPNSDDTWFANNSFNGDSAFLDIRCAAFSNNVLISTFGESATNYLIYDDRAEIKDQLLIEGAPQETVYEMEGDLIWSNAEPKYGVTSNMNTSVYKVYKNYQKPALSNVTLQIGDKTSSELGVVKSGNDISITPTAAGTYTLQLEAYQGVQYLTSKEFTVNVNFDFTGQKAFNLTPTSGETFTATYEVLGTTETPTWAVYEKDTTVTPSWANIDSEGVLTITTSGIPAGQVTNLQVVATLPDSNTSVTMDIRVVGSGMNKIFTVDGNEITLLDNLTQNQINQLTNAATYNLPVPAEETTKQVARTNIKEVRIISVDNGVTSIPNLFLYYASNLETLEWSGFSNVTSIGGWAMQGTKIRNLDLSVLSNVVTVGEAFLINNQAEEIDLSWAKNVRTIKSAFLCGCPNLKRVVNANFSKIMSIDFGFMSQNASLEEFDIKDFNFSKDAAFGSGFLALCNNLTKVNMRDFSPDQFAADVTGGKHRDLIHVFCGASSDQVPAYTQGISLTGSYKDEFKKKFPPGRWDWTWYERYIVWRKWAN